MWMYPPRFSYGQRSQRGRIHVMLTGKQTLCGARARPLGAWEKINSETPLCRKCQRKAGIPPRNKPVNFARPTPARRKVNRLLRCH